MAGSIVAYGEAPQRTLRRQRKSRRPRALRPRPFKTWTVRSVNAVEVRGPAMLDEPREHHRHRDGVRGVVGEPDRQEAEHQRTRVAPEPEVLVQGVHQRDDDPGGHQESLFPEGYTTTSL